MPNRSENSDSIKIGSYGYGRPTMVEALKWNTQRIENVNVYVRVPDI